MPYSSDEACNKSQHYNQQINGFKWDADIPYVPSWMEIVVTLTVLAIEIWIFRWIVRRLPVLRESPSWAPAENH